MNSLLLVASILGAGLTIAAPDNTYAQSTPLIGPEAVFHPGKDFLKTFHIQERWMSLMSATRMAAMPVNVSALSSMPSISILPANFWGEIS
ncbi:MAG: hypothetical protein Q8O92_07740 [Candidatus Latescibacter sp.]|nr:hypothetical protein [Candidatus Latescibacter sp.]